jgi:hypothetical protein
MAKPTKKQIEALARKLWRTRWNGRDMIDSEWDRACPELRASWRHVARLAVAEIGRLSRPAPRRRAVKQPKACRIDGGKRVCR